MKQMLAGKLVAQLQAQAWKLRCVESCTAGGLTAAVGAVAGVSAVLDRSWVTYSNQAKIDEVGVSAALLAAYGAVSEQVVLAMAYGAVLGCAANTLAISISGVAGPAGGTVDKPVGTVWIGLKAPHVAAQAQCFYFQGDRQEVQAQAVQSALEIALDMVLKGSAAS